MLTLPNGRHKALSRIDGELIYQKSEGGYDAEADHGIVREGARDFEKYPSLIAGQRVYPGGREEPPTCAATAQKRV